MDCSKSSARAVAALPDDPLVEILSRVPAKSLCRFKCVSKAWRDLINHPLHRKKLPQAMEGLFFFAKRSGGHRDARHLRFIDLMERSVPVNIDHRFSLLTGLPETQTLVPLDSCNGLMLLEHRTELSPDDTLGYIVFNPTTKQWGTVPTCGCPSSPPYLRYTYLVFDPAISSHFHLIHWREQCESGQGILLLHVYSSETGAWSHNQTNWVEQGEQGLKAWHHMGMRGLHAFVNGMLHLFVSKEDSDEHQILVVDVQGIIQRMISLPVPVHMSLAHLSFLAHSQGLLHYIIRDYDTKSEQFHLYVWVLQDYDTKKWVRKFSGCLPKPVGKLNGIDQLVAMHQDRNVLFFIQDWNLKLMAHEKLIAFDIDRKEVSVLTAPRDQIFSSTVALYIPYFAHSPALTNKD